MNDSFDEVVVMEGGSNNFGDMSGDLSGSNDSSDLQEQEEQEEELDQEDLDQEQSDLYQVILTDIYDELVDIHADIFVLNDSVNNVALCVEQFANVTVELFVIFVFMVLIKTVIDNLLHFFK